MLKLVHDTIQVLKRRLRCFRGLSHHLLEALEILEALELVTSTRNNLYVVENIEQYVSDTSHHSCVPYSDLSLFSCSHIAQFLFINLLIANESAHLRYLSVELISQFISKIA